MPDNPSDKTSRLIEIAALFTRLGFTGFGGPAVHMAMMEDEVVTRRKWIDRQHFLDLVASVNFVPGPNSTELAIHLGYVRAGVPGLIVAGACFITPAVLIILPLAFFYVRSGTLPQLAAAMSGINACVVAIVLAAAWRFGVTSIRDGLTTLLAIVAAVIGFVGIRYPQIQPELLALALAAIIGAIYYGRPRVTFDNIAMLALPLASSRQWWTDLAKMSLFFLKVGATLFGSGYVLVSYLQIGLVDQFHWLTKRELLDAISVGQVTPGPVLTTATFIGYVLGAQKFHGGVIGGVIGAIAATVAIFFPSFLFILALGRVLPRIRQNRFARGALDAMNAAVVALIVVVCWRLGADALARGGKPDFFAITIAVASLVAILWKNINATWLILASGVLGLLRLL
ncbi:MAG: chromate transporter [Phycisphaerales bacterium]|nr:chromate transporter [Phycisphaerales bacterium]